ncbi:FG-GAP repeat domain-containing protein [Arthrobacter halodurans]
MKHLNSIRLLAAASTTAALSVTLGGAPAFSDVDQPTISTHSIEQGDLASSPSLRRDVNGDGRADIVGFGNDGAYVSLGQSNSTFTQPVLAVNNYGYNAGGWRVERHPRHLADVNGDGRADIVGFGNDGAYVSRGRTNGTFTQPVLAVNNYGYNAGGWRVDQHPRLLADVNGDDRADIVGFGNDGAYVSLGRSNGTFTQPVLAVNNYGYNAGGWRVERHPRHLADVNGDDRADIVGFGNDGAYVSLGQSNGTFTQPVLAVNNYGYNAGGWRVERHPRHLADVNGDDRADIVGFGNDGAYVSRGRSNGTFTQPVLAVNNYGYNAGGWRVDQHPRLLAGDTD